MANTDLRISTCATYLSRKSTTQKATTMEMSRTEKAEREGGREGGQEGSKGVEESKGAGPSAS